MVEGARLESEYTAKPYRGFESLPLRQLLLKNIGFLANLQTCPNIPNLVFLFPQTERGPISHRLEPFSLSIRRVEATS